MPDLVSSRYATGSTMWANMGIPISETHPQMSVGNKYLNRIVLMQRKTNAVNDEAAIVTFCGFPSPSANQHDVQQHQTASEL
jgi:hypothetical protein